MDAKRFEPTRTSSSWPAADGPALPAGARAGAQALPLRFDVSSTRPSTLRIENNLARHGGERRSDAARHLRSSGVFGRAEIDRGESSSRATATSSRAARSTSANPARIEPLFDIEAETRVRVPRQTYRVTLGITGTPASFAMNLNSDPPLPGADIVLLLFGQTTDVVEPSCGRSAVGRHAGPRRSCSRPRARLLAGSISAPVGRAVEQTLGVDTADHADHRHRHDPLPVATSDPRQAAVDRASDFSRRLAGPRREQVIVLEYDQTIGSAWC